MKVVITGLDDSFRGLLTENNGVVISRKFIEESIKRALKNRVKQERERAIGRLKVMSILYHMGE